MGLGSFFKRGKKEEKSKIQIDNENCDLCQKCSIACQNNVLLIVDNQMSVGNELACKECRACEAICENDCITIN